jgi:ABC-type siderophore export system fused ATPase/permease subunit
MIDILIALVVGLLAALGGVFIKDAKALAVFTILIAVAAFLLAVITNMSTISLGLLGLAVATVRIGIAGKRVVEHRIKTYRSRRRLSKLEESVKTVPENIVDVIPAGSVRSIHPWIVNLVTLVNNAYAKGYAVEEPSWFRIVRQYLATVGPQFSADRTKVLSEYEITELE